MTERQKPLKVCFMIPGFSDGGAQKQCIYLLNALQQRADVELSLIRFHDGPHDHLLDTHRLTIHETRVTSNFDPRAALFALRTVQRTKPDILLSWLHACDVYSALIRKMVPTLRWIMTERNSRYPDELRFNLRRRLGVRADAVVSNSRLGDMYWENADAHGKRFIVNNIVPAATTPNVNQQDTIVSIGRLEPQKNVLVLAKAFCTVAQRRPHLRFQLIGKGALAGEVAAVIAAFGVKDRVEMLGFRSDVDQLLSQARLSVLLSHHEGLPNVLLESIARDIPVVASDIPEHRDLLGDNYPYYVARREDPEEAAKVIERTLDAKQPLTSLHFAKDRLSQMSPEAVAGAYLRIFNTVMEDRPLSHPRRRMMTS